MAIERIGTDLVVTNGTAATISGSYTLVAGSNRCGVMLSGIENGNNITGATPTLGGNAPAGTVRAEQGAGFEDDALISWWFEADLPADGSQTAQLVWTTTANALETSMRFLCLQNVAQSAPSTDTVTGANGTSASIAFSPAAGDWVLAILSLGSQTPNPAWQNGETELDDFADASSRFSTAEHGSAAGTETAIGCTFATANRVAFAGIHFAQAATPVGLVLPPPIRSVNHLLVR